MGRKQWALCVISLIVLSVIVACSGSEQEPRGVQRAFVAGPAIGALVATPTPTQHPVATSEPEFPCHHGGPGAGPEGWYCIQNDHDFSLYTWDIPDETILFRICNWRENRLGQTVKIMLLWSLAWDFQQIEPIRVESWTITPHPNEALCVSYRFAATPPADHPGLWAPDARVLRYQTFLPLAPMPA